MTVYRHTQPGTLIRRMLMGIGSILALIPVGMVIFRQPLDATLATIPAPVITAICLALFHNLTVEVSQEEITIAFGIGLIRKRFSIADIVVAKVTRTAWYHGWGIRKIRGGWLYNVSGLDAVELTWTNGRLTQIGTNEPTRLLEAIEQARQTDRAQD